MYQKSGDQCEPRYSAIFRKGNQLAKFSYSKAVPIRKVAINDDVKSGDEVWLFLQRSNLAPAFQEEPTFNYSSSFSPQQGLGPLTLSGQSL